MDDTTFRQLLDYLNLSWDGYRKVRKGVKKRIRRHMRALECRTLSDYLVYLDHNPSAREACDRLMTVSISRFFRDRVLWRALEERLLPELIDRYPQKIRAWSAGCAGGEEIYSLAMVWERLKARIARLPQIEFLATDTNAAALEHARRGRYPRSSLKELPDDVRAVFFKPRKNARQFEIQPFLSGAITFRTHDLLTDPPADRFQIIFLRNNLLTYYKDTIKIPAFTRIVNTLAPLGVLIIGSHEKLPLEAANLHVDPDFNYVFKAET